MANNVKPFIMSVLISGNGFDVSKAFVANKSDKNKNPLDKKNILKRLEKTVNNHPGFAS